MMIFMVVLCIAVFAFLSVVAGIVPIHTSMSAFELGRRSNNGDARAREIARREKLLVDVVSLQRVFSALLLVLLVTLMIATFGWLVGIILATLIALEYGAVARIRIVQRKSQKLYERYEPALLRFIEKNAGLFRVLRNVSSDTSAVSRLESREELQHLVEGSGALLSTDEKRLISHGLSFETLRVREIMTPRGVIDSIGKKELLGPLVLDDLHKTGHSRFPVIDGDIDHVIGMLHVRDILTLDIKRSVTAEKAMEARVFYIREDQTLQHALAAFLRTHHHLFVVVNEFRETVGILSLEDVIEKLLGRKIIDEFDMHDDLRVVAARNLRDNNLPQKREDV
jgi:CBS domain containing-hemolysin-like protein